MVHHHFPINFSHFNDILRVTSDGVGANMGILTKKFLGVHAKRVI